MMFGFRSKRTVWLLLLVAVPFVLTLAACQQGSLSSSTVEGKKSKESMQAERAAMDFSLEVALDSQPPTLDPHVTASEATYFTARHIFEGLMAMDREFRPVPMLAEKVDVSDDGKVYTFFLRKNVKFHNGKTMTAEDVVASMNRWLKLNDSVRSYFGAATFEAASDDQVSLVLEEPVSGVLDVLATHKQFPAIMPKELVESADDKGVQEYVGTGPYKFAEWKQDQYIHFARFDDYQPIDLPSSGLSGKKEAYAKNIYFRIVPDASTRLAGIQTGGYDISLGLPYDSYVELKGAPTLNVDASPFGAIYLVFNKKQGPTKEAAFRQGVNAALDLNAIMLASYTDPDLYTLDPGYMSRDQKAWYSDAGKESYNIHDVDKAKSLLAPYAQEKTYSLMVAREYEDQYNAAIVINEQLEAAGIKVKLDVVDWPTLVDRRRNPELWDMYMARVSNVNVPAQILPLSPDWPGWATDDKLMGLHKKIRLAKNMEEAKRLWDEMQAYVWNEYVPAVKIGDTKYLSATKKNIDGYFFLNGPVLWNVTKK